MLQNFGSYFVFFAASKAANKSASCQDRDDMSHSKSPDIVVILLSMFLTAVVVAFIVTVMCLITRHQQQLAAVRYGVQ